MLQCARCLLPMYTVTDLTDRASSSMLADKGTGHVVWMQAIAGLAELPSLKLQVPGVVQEVEAAGQGVYGNFLKF